MPNSVVPIPLYSEVLISARTSVFLKTRQMATILFFNDFFQLWLLFLKLYLTFSPLAWFFLSLIQFPVMITNFSEAEFYQWYDLHFLSFSIDMNLTKHNTERCL